MIQEGRESLAERVFAEHVERLVRGEPSSLDDLCARHPEVEGDLRRLAEEMQRLDALLAPARDAEDALSSVSTTLAEGEAAWTAFVERLKTRGEGWRRYRLVGELGRGGMGVVHRVIDEDTRRALAMKVIQEKALEATARGGSSTTLGRFLEEAQITAQLDHPNVVPVHELGVDEAGRVYFTMKLVKGETFRTVIERVEAKEPGWTRTRAVGILVQVCEAVAFAHSKGVVHRDLKPDNVMVGAYGETYVMDWGLARVLGQRDHAFEEPAATGIHTFATSADADSPRASLTGRHERIGTPYYMSPEQADGRREEIGPASDVYAIGAILYQLLAGSPPYHRRGRQSAQDVMQLVCDGPPAPIRKRVRKAPEELAAICETAMARNVADRYPSMKALADDLRAYLENRVVRAHRAGPVTRAWKWVARNRAKAAVLGIGFLAAVALLLLVLAKRDTRRAEQRGAEMQSERDQRAAEVLEKDRLNAEVQILLAKEAEARALADRKSREAEEESREAERLREEADGEREKARAAETRALAEKGVAEAERDNAARTAQALESALATASAAQARTEAALLEVERARNEATRSWITASLLQAQKLSREANELWPVEPEHAEIHERWLREADDLLARRAELEALAATPPEWLDLDVLAALGSTLGALDRPDLLGANRTSIRARRELARRLASAVVEHQQAWRSGLASIADVKEMPRYRGLRIGPVPCLVPVGIDPSSGLWEFRHAPSAEPPLVRGGAGEGTGASTGMVFVLLPPGETFLGAQTEPSMRNFDSAATSIETPEAMRAHAVAAHFVSKHEISRAQWRRLETLGVEGVADGGDLPQLGIAFRDAVELARVSGLALPDELEWEYAARGRTGTRYWTGDNPAEIARAGNLAAEGGPRGNPWPVGSSRPNPFGLHDVIGNATEWAVEAQSLYSARVALDDLPEGDFADTAEAIAVGAPLRVCRGGSFRTPPRYGRSATRDLRRDVPGYPDVGVRFVIRTREARR